MQERFRREQFDLLHFEEHNMLELALFYCIPRQDTNEIAHRLIDAFGSLAGVLDAPYEDLLQVKGISEYAATYLKLLPALFRGYAQSEALHSVPVLDSSEKAKAYFTPRFVGRTEEVVLAAFLDAKNRVKSCELLHRGTVSSATVNVRRLTEYAVRCQADGVILAHNHPDGTAEPSPEDIMTTDAINYALKLIGIRLVDHIIVAQDGALSLADIHVLQKD